MTSTPRSRSSIERLFRQPLRPAQDRRQRVVQLVRDARDRLSKRGHLLRLQQLLIQVARLIVELLPLADVANERDELHCLRPVQLGVGGDLDPDRGTVHPPQAQQVVGDRAVALEPLEECRSRRRVGKAIRRERIQAVLRRICRVAEDGLEVGVGGNRCPGTRRIERSDKSTLANGFEQTREGAGPTGPSGRPPRSGAHGQTIIGRAASVTGRHPRPLRQPASFDDIRTVCG